MYEVVYSEVTRRYYIRRGPNLVSWRDVDGIVDDLPAEELDDVYCTPTRSRAEQVAATLVAMDMWTEGRKDWTISRVHNGEEYRTTVHGATEREVTAMMWALRKLNPDDYFIERKLSK